ncbi:MAG: FHA domain-containing protein [Bacteroidaceae bacterium]|nr:FHA domain-containing protein [Bacteroidaceae bacterium]
MEIIVGRKGNQPFAITEKSVSGRHLKVAKLADGKVEIEDLGSTNGTFVDGARIIKKIVTEDTIVTLGPTFQIRIGDVLVASSKPIGGQQSSTQQTENCTTEFEKLKAVYDNYQAEKIKIQQENAKKQFMRSLPGVATTVLFALTFLFGDSVNAIKPIMGAIMFGGIILSSWLAYKGQQDNPVKMENLNKQFMVDYVCPKCKSFLGFLPFENLKNRGCCTACKTKW